MSDCIICGKELEEFERDVCNSCFKVLTAKYPRTKYLQEVIKCHKKNAKKLKQ